MKNEIINELKELKSTLPKIKDKDIYFAPDGYFDSMKDSVISKINKEKDDKKSPVIRFNKFWITGIAAAIVFILGIVFLMNQNNNPSEEFNTEETYSFLIDNLDDLDDEVIILALSEDDIETEEENEPSIEEINEYLEENIEDLSDEDIQQIF